MSRFHSQTWGARPRRALGVLLFSSVLGVVASASCGEGETGTAERTLTGSVPLTDENTLIVDAIVEVLVEGSPRANEISYELVAVVTASTASTAARAADALVVAVARPEGRVVRITVGPPIVGTIAGQLTLTVPSDLHLGVIEKANNVSVVAMEGDIQVDSISSVRVVDPKRTVSIGIQNGNGLIDSTLPAGTLTEVLVQTGDIQLTIPSAVSASIDARPGGGGSVIVSHPLLPRSVGTGAYTTVVGGGLSTVRLQTMRGNVIIRTP